MYTVEIKDLEIYGFIGYYPEEQIIGNYFYVDVFFSLPEYTVKLDDLESAVNYAAIAYIVQEEFETKCKLIETTASKVLERLTSMGLAYSKDAKVIITIKKKNPVLGNRIAFSAITLTN